MTAYLEVADALTLAATLPGMDAYLAKDAASQAALLLLASIDIDAAGPYQGRKFDITPGAQEREFPRVAYGPPAVAGLPRGIMLIDGLSGLSTIIWDWNPNTDGSGTGAAVVPPAVQIATLYQAAWLLQPKYAKRLESIRSGLAAQEVGGAREQYVRAGEAVPGGFTGLSDRSSRLMQQYRIKTGELL